MNNINKLPTEAYTKEFARAINYVEYYEMVEPIKRYSLDELTLMSVVELLDLMPQNQCVDEYKEIFGYHVTKHITSFEIHKIIDGTWCIGFYEGNRNIKMGDRYTLFELSYISDFKKGLIDLFLMVQNRSIEYYNDIKMGRIKISLSENWDNRKELGLD